jgi:hypothetical protein
MKSNYLLPNKYKPLGWILFITGIVSMIFYFFGSRETEPLKIKVLSIFNGFAGSAFEMEYYKIIEDGFFHELVLLFIIFGGLIIGFSKEKIEDEFIYKLRTDSLIWAIIFNYFILTLMVLLIYSFEFIYVLAFNICTPLLFFILRFNFLKIKSRSCEE